MKKVTTNRAVKTSCKNTKVRTASGDCAPERKPMMKSGGTSPFGILSIIAGIDKNPKPTAADRIAGAKKGTKKIAASGMTRSLKKSQMGGANTMGSYDPGSGIQTSNMPSPQAKFGGSTHPGFKAVQSKIAAKQGVSKQAAGAILASSTRKASAKAKAKNPRLKRVK
jgi:hypothetical protein